MVPPRANPLAHPLMGPDKDMNVSASPNMARVLKEDRRSSKGSSLCLLSMLYQENTTTPWHRRL